MFHAIFAFGANVEEYLHLIIPVITKTVERSDISTSLRITAVQTIDGLAKKVNFSDHASRIIHPLVRVLDDPYTAPELAIAILDTLSVLLIQLGADFAIFVPMINKVREDKHHGMLHTTLTRIMHFFCSPCAVIRGSIMPNTTTSSIAFSTESACHPNSALQTREYPLMHH